MSILGGMAVGAGLGLLGADKQNKWSSAESEKARDWMAYMSNTAIQRQVNDLRKAGLNPVLAASLGGASAQASGFPQSADIAGAMSKGAATALQAKQVKATADNLVENTKKVQAETAQAHTDLEVANLQKRLSFEAIDRMEKQPVVKDMMLAGMMSKITGGSATTGQIINALNHALGDQPGGHLGDLINWFKKVGKGGQNSGKSSKLYKDTINRLDREIKEYELQKKKKASHDEDMRKYHDMMRNRSKIAPY